MRYCGSWSNWSNIDTLQKWSPVKWLTHNPVGSTATITLWVEALWTKNSNLMPSNLMSPVAPAEHNTDATQPTLWQNYGVTITKHRVVLYFEWNVKHLYYFCHIKQHLLSELSVWCVSWVQEQWLLNSCLKRNKQLNIALAEGHFL